MPLRGLAYIAGILPLLSIYIAYYMAMYQGHVPACIPNLEGCTSISSTGRQVPESLFFRATMIPSAVMMALFWIICRQWLIKQTGYKAIQYDVILFLGLVSTLFLVIYTVALGYIGETYALQRRIGVTLYFSCSLLAQLFTTNLIWKLVKQHGLHLRWVLHRWLLVICVLMVVTGLALTPLALLFPGQSRSDNIVEWNYAILMALFYVVMGKIWSITGFRMSFRIR